MKTIYVDRYIYELKSGIKLCLERMEQSPIDSNLLFKISGSLTLMDVRINGGG